VSFTIRSARVVEGVGMHTGRRVRASLVPVGEPGVFFCRSDVPGSDPVAAITESLAESERCTVLHNGQVSVVTVEHLLAACWALDVAGLTVELDSEELPAGDGSAAVWVDAIKDAGLCEIPSQAPVSVESPIVVNDGARSIELAPAEAWSVHYSAEVATEDSASERSPAHDARLTDRSGFMAEFVAARTFCRLSEVVEARRSGYIRGGTPENSLVHMDVPASPELAADISRWWPDVTLETTAEGLLAPQRLRWPNEFARHKVLDLMGDVYLAGPMAPCRIECRGSGHSTTHRLLRELARQKDEPPGNAHRRKRWANQ